MPSTKIRTRAVVRATAKYSVYESPRLALRLELEDGVRAHGLLYMHAQERLETMQMVMDAKTGVGPRELVDALRHGYSMCSVAMFLIDGDSYVLQMYVDAEEDERRMRQRIAEEKRLLPTALRWHTNPATLSYDAAGGSFRTTSKDTAASLVVM
jgi:hypothetical protein